MLQIDRRDVQDVAVLDLTGRLIFGDETQMLSQKIREISKDGRLKILINLERVDEVLSLVKLPQIIDLCDSEDAAIESFSA